MSGGKASSEVACEDIVTFINGCFASTGQAEFYEQQGSQTLSIEFLHEYILFNYRRLYALTLSANINHFNQALIIFNLLREGAPKAPDERALEGELIRSSLHHLPANRAYKLFERLQRKRVNNRRTRAVIRGYLEARKDPAFDAVKYRKRVAGAVAHCHLPLRDEREAFLFKSWQGKRFQTPLFATFQRARYAQEAIYELPFTVAEGLAQKHKVPRAVFLKKIEPMMTARERARLIQSATRAGHQLKVDLSRSTLTQVALYALSLSSEERAKERARCEEALTAICARALGESPVQLGRTAAILDNSYSSSGSHEKAQRPLAVAFALHQLLSVACPDYLPLWTQAPTELWELKPIGPTSLARPLIEALKWGAERVIIVSDGHENDPSGALHELVRVFRERLDPKGTVSIVHLNPVFNAESFEPKRLSPLIPTIGVRDAEDLFTALSFADFASGEGSLEALEAHLRSLRQTGDTL